MEYVPVQLMGWLMKQSRFARANQVFFSRSVAIWFFELRKLMHGTEGLGDSQYEEKKIGQSAKGIWVTSPSRGPHHDLIVYYVHGGDFVSTSVYFYLEYLSHMLVSLHGHGFRNPAIFAIDYAQGADVSYFDQLQHVAIGWDYVCRRHEYSNIAIVGDSNGATLSLSLLLHRVQPRQGLYIPKSRKDPVAALLVSPWTLVNTDRETNKSDYLHPKVLSHYIKKSGIPNAGDDPYSSPGKCRSQVWWTNAMPVRGLYITYGAEEILGPEIEKLYQRLRLCSRVKVEAEKDQIHAWPITKSYFARDIVSKEIGVEAISQKLEIMTFWDSDTNVNLN